MAKTQEFLRLCGYIDDEEIKRTIPRLEEAMRRSKMEPGDIDHAIDALHKAYRADLDLVSVRQIIGVWLRKWMALMFARDEYKKVVYHFHVGEPRQVMMLNAVSDDIYCDYADLTFFMAAGFIFDNVNRYLEMGEKAGLPPARAHCGASLIGLGIQAEGILARPDLVVGSNTQCDQQHKVAEMVAELWNVPMVKPDTVADEPWGLFPEISDRAVKYWGATLEDSLVKKTEEILDIKITDEVVAKSRHQYAWLWRVEDEIHNLVAEADPRPAGSAVYMLVDMMNMPVDRIVIKEGIPATQLHLKELKERVANGYGVIPKGAPKVMMFCGVGPDMISQNLIEDVGLNAVVTTGGSWLADFEKNPKIDYARFKQASPMEKVAAAYLRKGYVRACDHHIWRLTEMAKELKARNLLDGILLSVAYQCRSFIGLPIMAKQTIEKEIGIPVQILELGAFDSRDHNYDTEKTRVQAFAELLRARKATSEAAQ